MKASEVLRRYAAGERDFHRTNLRGQSFKGQDLSGADFSESDIRGANFSHASLRGASFRGTRAGTGRLWIGVQLMIASLVAILAGVFQGYFGYFQALYFPEVWDSQYPKSYAPEDLASTIAFLVISALASILIAQQGFTLKNLKTLTFSTLSAVAVGGVVAGVFNGIVGSMFTFIGIVTGIILFIIEVPVVLASAFTFAGVASPTISTISTGIIALIIAISGTYLGVFSTTKVNNEIASTGIVIAALLSCYTVWKGLKDNEKFIPFHNFGIAIGAIGGTRFYKANLNATNFTNATLQNSDFDQATLTHVCWHEAQKLECAKVGNSILASSTVRQLLVTRNGYKKSYVDANLRGANLDGVNLQKANLKWADLSEATLHHADLRGADLSETLVLGADFTGASLTGACLEGWNIDHNTKLDKIDCQYVYLLRNQQERRPSSGDFAPGEFTKLFQEVLSTVDLIFRNGIDWKAFTYSFNKLVLDNQGTELSIQSIENKGDGVVVVRVNAPPDADKAKLHSEFNQTYDAAVKALEAKYQAELKAKDDQIVIYRQQSADMLEITRLMANRPIHVPINVQAIAEAKAMNDSTDSSRKIEIGNIGGDFHASGQALNLGDISGIVTNAINQLPDAADPNQPNLKQLLMQLKDAVETDPDLPDDDKRDLLEQVQNLAEAQQTEEPAKKEGLARKAKKMFEATLKSLPETAKIAEACTKLLPMILKALGLPM